MADVTIKYAEGQCQEGCGKQTAKGRRFVQGHDARLKSVLYDAIRTEKSVQVNGKAADPAKVVDGYGWPQPAERKPRKRAAAKPKATSAKKSTAKRSSKTKAA